MSPHAVLRERAIFAAELERERQTRKPGEGPTLTREPGERTAEPQRRRPEMTKPVWIISNAQEWVP